MSKHTPGPWELKRVSVIAGGIRISQSGYIGGQSQSVIEAAERTREANAKLIAAAPDMLAALVECYEYIDELNGNLGQGEIMEKVWQVIVKANGQLPSNPLPILTEFKGINERKQS